MWRCCIWDWALPANAVRHFQASAAIKPESAAAHFNLGTALAQAGRFDDSIKAFREALARRPDYALAHGNLGRVLLVKGETWRKRSSTCRKRCASTRTIRRALLGLSEALAQRGAFDLAIDMLERAMKLPLSEEPREARFSRSARTYLKKTVA